MQLLARLRSASVEEQRAITWLLSQLGSQRSVPALLDLSKSKEIHAAAVQALAFLADDVTLARLVRDEEEPALQRALAGKLLARSSPQSVALYLDLLSLPSTRPSAVAVLDELSHPPVDVLFAFLNSAEASRQLQAAIVLGRLDGPQITQRLIEQVQWHVNRQEALVALLASSGMEAHRFVTSARNDQTLFAAVNSAEFELQRAFQ
jgi:HEAT repeat protein